MTSKSSGKPILIITVDELSSVGVPKARLVPGQKIDGAPGDVTLDIVCESEIRVNNPVGTIFEVDNLIKKKIPGGREFYDTWHEDSDKKFRLRIHQK